MDEFGHLSAPSSRLITSRTRGILLYVVIALATAGAASWIGYRIGMRFWKHSYAVQEREQVLAGTKGLVIGRALPAELVLWDANGTNASYVSDLSLHDATLIYLGPSARLNAGRVIDSVSAAMTVSDPRTNVWIVTDFDPAGLNDDHQSRVKQPRMLWDMSHYFRSEVGLADAMVYLTLDGDGRLKNAGIVRTTSRELRDLVTTD